MKHGPDCNKKKLEKLEMSFNVFHTTVSSAAKSMLQQITQSTPFTSSYTDHNFLMLTNSKRNSTISLMINGQV